MTAFNVVRFKVKPDMVDEFLTAHMNIGHMWKGLLHANIIDAGNDRFFIVAEWESQEALANARPQMIETLNSFRHTLQDLGNGLGMTDPIAGPVTLSLK